MTQKTQRIIKYFKDHTGVARFSELLKAGFHPDSLSLLEKQGNIEKIARGLYRLKGHDLGSHPDLVLASFQAPQGVICLISALYFHKVTDEIPHRIDIAIPSGARANKIKYPPVKFYRFSPKTHKAGVKVHTIGGHKIRVYSLAKTLADCFKFRNKIGINIARDALKTAIKDNMVTPAEVLYFAKLCRVVKIIKPILETIL